jgi:hypothetical protein
MKSLALLGLAALTQTAIAADYTTLFDPSTMTVGQKVGEYLEVKEYCPKTTSCTAAEKQKYVTATTGRTGRLEFPVNAGNDFEISFNMKDSGCWNVDHTYTLYMSDGSSLPLSIGRGSFDCSVLLNGKTPLQWTHSVINDFRLIASNGLLKISLNDILLDEPFSLSGTINRVVISKINEEQESLYDIRTRGIQTTSAVSCPTTSTPTTTQPTVTTNNSSATFNLNTGRLVIPNLEVSMTQPFGGTPQIFNYGIEMQQRTGAFVFDLDLNKVVQR